MSGWCGGGVGASKCCGGTREASARSQGQKGSVRVQNGSTRVQNGGGGRCCAKAGDGGARARDGGERGHVSMPARWGMKRAQRALRSCGAVQQGARQCGTARKQRLRARVGMAQRNLRTAGQGPEQRRQWAREGGAGVCEDGAGRGHGVERQQRGCACIHERGGVARGQRTYAKAAYGHETATDRARARYGNTRAWDGLGWAARGHARAAGVCKGGRGARRRQKQGARCRGHTGVRRRHTGARQCAAVRVQLGRDDARWALSCEMDATPRDERVGARRARGREDEDGGVVQDGAGMTAQNGGAQHKAAHETARERAVRGHARAVQVRERTERAAQALGCGTAVYGPKRPHAGLECASCVVANARRVRQRRTGQVRGSEKGVGVPRWERAAEARKRAARMWGTERWYTGVEWRRTGVERASWAVAKARGARGGRWRRQSAATAQGAVTGRREGVRGDGGVGRKTTEQKVQKVERGTQKAGWGARWPTWREEGAARGRKTQRAGGMGAWGVKRAWRSIESVWRAAQTAGGRGCVRQRWPRRTHAHHSGHETRMCGCMCEPGMLGSPAMVKGDRGTGHGRVRPRTLE
ncbi:hypothetical protein DENSPDRAFT_849504 [Dentipellis sp. KUC8613]|nr:hypothetical protein DENSPDRAFT_849504 [Dentipellis sp. KUC8613]